MKQHDGHREWRRELQRPGRHFRPPLSRASVVLVAQDEQRTKRQAIMEEQNKKLKEILTPDQMEKYKKMQEEMKKKYGGKKKTE